MAARAVRILILALMLTACSGVESTSSTPEPLVLPDVSRPADCVNPPPDVSTLVAQSDPLACYGGADLRVEAQIRGIGVADCPGGLEPAWFSCERLVGLHPLPGTSRLPEFLLVARSQPGDEPVYAVLHPDVEELRARAMDALVTVTGHYDDPAARTCHHTSWPDANPPAADEVVHMCRSTFVIAGIEQLEPDPDAQESTPSRVPTNALAPGGIVQAVDTDIVVRSAPGLGADSEIYPETISSPTLAYVFAGPVPMDGYDWYQVVPADPSYLPSPYGLGWIAAGSREGAPWIAAAAPDCPEPTLDAIVELSGTARLSCFADEPLTLDGILGGCSATSAMTDGSGTATLALPWSGECYLQTFDCCPQVVPYAGGMAIRLGDGVELPADAEGRSARVTGHFDDAGSASCKVTGDSWMDARLQRVDLAPPAGWGEYLCRTELVVTDLEFTPDP